MRDRAEPSKTTSEPAVTRRRSEGVTLAVAVTFAVGLGVAFGIWINARLTPTSSAGTPRPARLLPDARASAPAARPSPCDGCETSSVGEATPARAPADKADEAGPRTDSGAPTGGARAAAPDAGAEPSRADEVADGSAEEHDATASEGTAAASPDPPRPVAWQVGALPKAGSRAVARGSVERGAAQSEARAAGRGAQAQSAPCALYVSANSLGVHVGGAAPLILGGPGAGVRINVSTPDWSHLAVIYEGPAAGHNGWLTYSVRSVDRRPGLYTVRVSSPCGSRTIPVTVK
jgi:hypothetical protein